MNMNTHQPLEEVMAAYANTQQQPQRAAADQKKLIKPPPVELSLRCPRCDSGNTKFCYYNNYSLSQPRYFCKGCRRYWTQGGSLRNVPVGGGCRRKRTATNAISSSFSSCIISAKKPQDQLLTSSNSFFLPSTTIPTPSSFPFDPNYNLQALVYDRLHAPTTNINVSGHMGLENSFFFENPNIPSPMSTASAVAAPGFLDILKGGFLDTGGYHHSLCYGNLEGVEVPLGEVAVEQESCRFNADENKAVTGLQWQVAAAGEANVAVDMMGRDCCWGRGAGSSTWHGLVNSSLM